MCWWLFQFRESAGRRNRTDITSLEGWGFTVKLYPQLHGIFTVIFQYWQGNIDNDFFGEEALRSPLSLYLSGKTGVLGASQLWVTLESRNTPFPTPSVLAADGSTLKINPRMQPPAPQFHPTRLSKPSAKTRQLRQSKTPQTPCFLRNTAARIPQYLPSGSPRLIPRSDRPRKRPSSIPKAAADFPEPAQPGFNTPFAHQSPMPEHGSKAQNSTNRAPESPFTSTLSNQCPP